MKEKSESEYWNMKKIKSESKWKGIRKEGEEYQPVVVPYSEVKDVIKF